MATKPLPFKDLKDIMVTPAIYVAMRLRLEKGEKLPFDDKALDMALRSWVNKHGDIKLHDAMKEAKTPMEFALVQLRQNRKTPDTARRDARYAAGPKPRQQSRAERDAQQFLQQHHAAPRPSHTPANHVDGAYAHDEQNGETLDDFLDDAYDSPEHLQQDLLHFAERGNHSEAVAAVLLATAISKSSPIAKAGAIILLNKYTTGTTQERELCLEGVSGALDENERKHHAEKLQHIAAQERDPRLVSYLLHLAGNKAAEPGAYTSASFDNRASRLQDFAGQGGDMTARHDTGAPSTFAIPQPVSHKRQPWELPGIPKVLTPNMNDKAFGGSGKKSDD